MSHERDLEAEDREKSLGRRYARRSDDELRWRGFRQNLMRSRFGVDEKGLKPSQDTTTGGGFFRPESRPRALRPRTFVPSHRAGTANDGAKNLTPSG
jgi:hypothetical protein